MGQIKNIKLHIVTDIKGTKTETKMPGGVTVKDVNPQEFVRAFAAHLKKIKTQSTGNGGNRENLKGSRIGTHRSRLVLREGCISGPACVPPAQRWSRSCAKNLWRC